MDVPHMHISTPERHERTGVEVDVTNVPSPNPRCGDSVFANVIPTNSITHDTLTVQIHPRTTMVAVALPDALMHLAASARQPL